MARKQKTLSKKKSKYRLRNWGDYNRSLVNRGSLTFWFDEKSIKKWYSTEGSPKPGHPDMYSDDTIRCGLLIRAVFSTTLRSLQGFLESIILLMGLSLKCPHYSVFCRRAKGLQISMRRFLKPGEKLNRLLERSLAPLGARLRSSSLFKTILGDRLSSRRGWSQALEVSIKLDALNKMLELGKPQSYKVSV